MGFRAAKISFDGSHYIATPKENFPRGKKRRRSSHPASKQETERKEQFETAYRESQQLPRKERKDMSGMAHGCKIDEKVAFVLFHQNAKHRPRHLITH